MRLIRVLGLGVVMGTLFAVLGQSPASADESRFQVNTTILSGCALGNTSAIALPPYKPVRSSADGPTPLALELRCNRQSTPVFVSLDEGLAPSSGSSCSAPLRNMVSLAGDRLPYRLYWGPQEPEQWGCTGKRRLQVGFSESVSAAATIWTVIPEGQDAPVGDYTDTVLVRLEF